MALFKIFEGNAINLPTRTNNTIGYCYVTLDEHKMYIDASSKRFALNAVKADYASNIVYNAKDITLLSPRELALLYDESNFIIHGIYEDDATIFDDPGVKMPCITYVDKNNSLCTVYQVLEDVYTHSTGLAFGSSEIPTKYCRYAIGTDYWSDWEPVKSKLNQAGDSDSPVYINADGDAVACIDFLPLSAGGNKKLTGPLGLTEDVNYGSVLPTSGFEGQLFFLEDNSIEVPAGGTSGQVLTKNTDANGDISWQDALPQGGTSGQYLAKNSDTNGDYVWKTTSVSNTVGAGTTAGPTIKTTVNGVAGSAVTIPSATTSNSGIVTTGSQSFTGTKTFKALHVQDNAISFRNTSVTKGTAPSANDGLYIQFCDSGGVAAANRHGMLYSDIDKNNIGRMFMYAYAPVSGSTDSAYIYVQRSADGTAKAGSSAPFYGAVWNDYAEFRSQKENIEPGYCVASADDGKVYKTTEKFQACDGIVSDTFGFSIGETDECKTPLAVAGRVLAYCEGNRYDYHSGDTVCAGPDGKVCKMTREEIREWPDRIIGIVSEIPEYERWGDGDVPVNNRIWIKVK